MSAPLPRAVPLFVVIVLAAGSSRAQNEPQRFVIEDLLDFESVANPRISAATGEVVYTRSWNDRVNDRRVQELWLLAPSGERPRRIARGTDAEWSPDGKRIAYLAEGEPRGTQIHVMWVETRETHQITRVEESPSSIRWAPDGKSIAFVMNVPEKESFTIKLPAKPKDAKWAPDPVVVTRPVYRRDGQGYRPQGWKHLFVVDADGGTPRQVSSGDFDHDRPEWTRDGEKLVCASLRVPEADWAWRESEIYAVSLSDGTTVALTDRRGPDHSAVVSPDGKRIAYLGFDANDDTYEITRAYVMDLDGGNRSCITSDLDRDVRDLEWRRDSKAVYFTADDQGTSDIWMAPVGGGASRITRGDHQLTLADVGKGGVIVGVLSNASEPGDVVSLVPDHPERRNRLTSVNADVLARKSLGKVEELRWKSAEDVEIQGWLVLPPDFDPAKKWPLVLQIHGGPHAMYGVGFTFERHYFASRGYVVLYSNPRGSTGYGKAFGNAIDNAYPGPDYADLMSGVDAAIAKGFVDPERLFVYGGSGGGTLTAHIVGSTDRFRAAVSMFPVTNWVSFVGTTDSLHWYRNFAKLPWEDVAEHWARSPLRLAGNVKTPTMILTGEMDLRTPMAQSEEYYQALRFRKVDTILVRIADEYHGAATRHPSNLMRRILYVEEWFHRHAP